MNGELAGHGSPKTDELRGADFSSEKLKVKNLYHLWNPNVHCTSQGPEDEFILRKISTVPMLTIHLSDPIKQHLPVPYFDTLATVFPAQLPTKILFRFT
jgi:hypothetical protein